MIFKSFLFFEFLIWLKFECHERGLFFSFIFKLKYGSHIVVILFGQDGVKNIRFGLENNKISIRVGMSTNFSIELIFYGLNTATSFHV